MTADWQRPGKVVVERQGETLVVRVRGNLHRDLAGVARDELTAELRKAGAERLALVDLRDLERIDSWGEEQVADLVDGVVAASGRVAVLTDPDRPYLLRGLGELLRAQGQAVFRACDEAEAKAWLARAST